MIYDFSEKQVPKLSEVGGKAKALIEMTNAGFPVPEGFVLSVSYFDSWIADLKEHKAWLSFLEVSSKENCDALKNIAIHFKMNDQQKQDFYKSLEKFSKSDIFAVRSSSPDEDLEGASFAGGYETTLGVTYDQLESAIVESFISMLDYRVVEYKKKHNIDIHKPSIAIIIQKQIPSDVSGIGFSANPQSGAKDEVMLNASFGLGETIVSGQVTPDIYIVKGNEIIKKKIANKHIALYLKDNGFTEERAVNNPTEESLSKNQALKLSKMIKKVEDYYKKPMDTEWAIAQNKIYLLQARPITTDLTQFSWKVGSQPKGTIFVRGSIVELMPDPLVPLYADYAKEHVPSTIKKLINRIFGDNNVFDSMAFPVLNGYGYYKFSMNRHFYWLLLKNIKKAMVILNIHPAWVEQEELPKIKARLAELQALNLKDLDTKELYEMTHELTETICTYYTYCQIYLAQAYKSEGLFIRYYDKKIKPKVNIPSHVFMLGDNTAPILADKALYALAQEIKEDVQTKEFVMKKSSDEIRALMENKGIEDDAFYKKFKAYLDVHGNMIYDLDFSKLTPHDDPRPIIEALKIYVADLGEDPIKRQKVSLLKREEAEKKVKESVSSSVYKRFDKKLQKARLNAPFRENGLANMGICQPFLRKVFFELGMRLKRKGIIKTHEDVFWLKQEELKCFVDGQDIAPLIDEITKRKTLWKKQKATNPPSLLPKNAKMFGIKVSLFLPKDLEHHDGDNTYEGNGVSSGKVTGKARVILSPEEFGTMKQGEILVTSMTTPAWTPLFAMASGIVTDFGGPLSHSSIVAREYGIPAVLGTGGLSKIIKSGQTITVDADNSVVIIEDKEIE